MSATEALDAEFAHSPCFRLALWTLRAVCDDLVSAGQQDALSSPRTLTDEQLDRLAYHFGDSLLASALELVDRRAVTLVRGAGRELHRVAGSSGTVYYCLKARLYCGCPSHKIGVVGRADVCLCKHSLALQLSDAMGLTTVETVTEQQLEGMMLNV